MALIRPPPDVSGGVHVSKVQAKRISSDRK